MMSVVALSLPEMILLRRVLKPKLIATFIVVVAAGILLVGLLFNLIWTAPPTGLPGPAELVASSFAGCLVKNVAGAATLLPFR